MPGQDLLALARRAMHVAAEAGELQQAAVTNLFWGRDRVMMASRALQGAAYMTKAVFKARRRGQWLPMPRFEPSGLEIYSSATRASNATFNARQLAVATAKPAATPPEPASRSGIAAPVFATPIVLLQRLTREAPSGMGTGGPDSQGHAPGISR